MNLEGNAFLISLVPYNLNFYLNDFKEAASRQRIAICNPERDIRGTVEQWDDAIDTKWSNFLQKVLVRRKPRLEFIRSN